MSFGEDIEARACPYCGVKLKRPYWQHIQKAHPESYASTSMWEPLYLEYKNLGMDSSMCIMVVSELYGKDQA